MEYSQSKNSSWLEEPVNKKVNLDWELIFWAAILILAIFSRMYILGARVISHDENSHVYYSWRFFKGQGFSHDPLMHGPLQFHLLALSYFMFGDSDFTGRLPQALCSIATVMFMWFYKPYLGKTGAMVAAVLMLISPYVLYYGRYARNEAFVALFGVIAIWAILGYLKTGLPRYTYWLTAVTVLHFTSKETSFIYAAQALLFLGLFLVYRLSQNEWPHPKFRNSFFLCLLAALVALGGAGAFMVWNFSYAGPVTLTPTPIGPANDQGALATSSPPAGLLIFLGLSAVSILVGFYFLIKGYTARKLRQDRSFSLIIILFTLVLPQLAAFPVRLMGWDIPTNAGEVMAMKSTDILQIAVFLIPLGILSVLLGLWWNRREWLINAGIWYGIFTVFYTSLFSNGAGFFTGMVGSLGYWIEQQGVERGNQPWYYYAAVQMPIYEYLPILGTWLAFGMAILDGLRSLISGKQPIIEKTSITDEVYPHDDRLSNTTSSASDLRNESDDLIAGYESTALHAITSSDKDFQVPLIEPAPVFPLIGFLAITSMIAFSVAGEKMPWLTVHVTLPAILCTGWSVGRMIDRTDWKLFHQNRGWLVLLLLPVFLLSLFATLSALLGPTPPFQGKELTQLQDTTQFLTSFLITLASAGGLIYLVQSWPGLQFARVITLAFFGLLAVLTARTAIQSNFANYDNANELLVYAHSAPGVKTAMRQIEELSRRTTDGLAVKIAYDNETSYPYWWYLRNYPNAQYYGENPSRSLRDMPMILVGDANFGKIEPIVANRFDRFDYIRLWWPNQDYYDLTLTRILNALKNPEMRAALFQIWLNRDYSAYGKVTNRDLSLPNWSPAARMRLYIRKDVVNSLWNYGAVPVAEEAVQDPFEEKHIQLTATRQIGVPGSLPGQFNRPRDISFAPDGTFYIVDTDNHRVQHLKLDGTPLQTWGIFGDVTTSNAPGGTFNQPWGIGVAPDGSVYVADTWNHRVQKFDSAGKFVTMWGYFGQGEKPEAMWGPRDIAVDSSGNVFVTDTGNKRVVVFDGNGTYVTQFGGPGLEEGQLDEPVGIVIGEDGLVYVVDTWNQRIQVFQKMDGINFQAVRSWEVPGWYGQSLDNKPYIAVDNKGSLFAADPEGYRVLQFTVDGQAVRSWGDYGNGMDQFGLPASVAVDQEGNVWVVDAGNSRVMIFQLPD